jgi:uncharacterized NAD-dependent epimerase/dehydratase family protein
MDGLHFYTCKSSVFWHQSGNSKIENGINILTQLKQQISDFERYVVFLKENGTFGKDFCKCFSNNKSKFLNTSKRNQNAHKFNKNAGEDKTN